MEDDPGTVLDKSLRLKTAACVILLLILAVAAALVFGLIGSSCNCGPFPRVSATTDGNTVVITYSGVWSEREGAWFPRRLPEEERELTGLRYVVRSPGGTESWQNLSAPAPGQDQTVRFEEAATSGKDQVIVTAGYADGSTMVVYDNYV